jgi:elongation factor G
VDRSRARDSRNRAGASRAQTLIRARTRHRLQEDRMATYTPDKLRNIVLLGHGSSGKTSLAEALLFDAGLTTRLGKVDDGNTVSDFDAEEQRRRMSVNTSILPIEYAGCKLNILDTPGYNDFVGEVCGAVRVVEGAVVVLDAVAGVEVGTELTWQHANDHSLPRIAFVNKMDRENANFDKAVASLREVFDVAAIPIQLPIGAEAAFSGVIDLIRGKAYTGTKGEETAVPAAMAGAVEQARAALTEAAAEGDDTLIEKFLEGEALTNEELVRGLRLGMRSGKVVPVLCGSALANVGMQAMLNVLVDLMPTPQDVPPAKAKNLATNQEEVLSEGDAGPLAAFVFKTSADPYVGKLTYYRVYSGVLESDSRALNSRSNAEERISQLFTVRGKEQINRTEVRAGDIGGVAKLSGTATSDTLCEKGHPLQLAPITYPKPIFSAAIFPKSKADLDKMSGALARLVEEDPTLRVSREPETNETILSGMGESHVDIAARRLQAKFGVEITLDTPKVPYRETITKEAAAQGRHKKQTGGHGQFGDVYMRFSPLPRGSGFEFADEVFGGSVPHNFIPAVEKGMREAVTKGVLAGYPVVDIKAALYDGSYHPVDSSEMAFKLAANLAFKKGMEDAGPILLEPIMTMTITIPEQFTGDVMSDLNTKRGRVMGMEQVKGKTVITAQAPLAEIQRYATDLKSMTQGRGVFSMEFSHHEGVPAHVAPQVIAAAKARAEKE